MYDIAPTLPDPNRVTDAIAHWQQNTVIKFKKRQTERDYVFFRPGGGCSSAIGKMGGVQFVTLSSSVFNRQRHPRDRSRRRPVARAEPRGPRRERDDPMGEHRRPAAHHNFRQQIEDGDDINEYDYGSIMHYPRDCVLDQRGADDRADDACRDRPAAKLSDGDIEAVAKMYENVTERPPTDAMVEGRIEFRSRAAAFRRGGRAHLGRRHHLRRRAGRAGLPSADAGAYRMPAIAGRHCVQAGLHAAAAGGSRPTRSSVLVDLDGDGRPGSGDYISYQAVRVPEDGGGRPRASPAHRLTFVRDGRR